MSDGNAAGVVFAYVVIWVLAIAIHVWLSHLIGKAAERRGRNYWAFFWLSLLVSWVIMGIIVATLPYDEGSSTARSVKSGSRLPDTVECPFCAEDIKVKALVCKHCGRDVADQLANQREAFVESSTTPAEAPSFDGPAIFCRQCQSYSSLEEDAPMPNNCPNCGTGSAFMERRIEVEEVAEEAEPSADEVPVTGAHITCRSCRKDSAFAEGSRVLPSNCPKCGSGAAFLEVIGDELT